MGDTIYFLHHSGFIYENETSLLVFDFYKDTENRLEMLLKDSTKKLYFFVSRLSCRSFQPRYTKVGRAGRGLHHA